MSVSLPLPSSPHWVPTTTVPGTRVSYQVLRRSDQFSPTGPSRPPPARGRFPLRVQRVARIIVVAASIVAITPSAAVAIKRLSYPFDLEWMEGGGVAHVQRVLDGRGLYPRPSLDFVPFIYTPLYWYVSAAAAWVLGTGYAPLRLVSLASSLGCFALVFTLVRRETGATWTGILAAG